MSKKDKYEAEKDKLAQEGRIVEEMEKMFAIPIFLSPVEILEKQRITQQKKEIEQKLRDVQAQKADLRHERDILLEMQRRLDLRMDWTWNIC